MLFKNALDNVSHITHFPRTVQSLELLIDRFADHVREGETLFPKHTNFSQALFIQPYIHKPRAHAVKISMYLRYKSEVIFSFAAPRFLGVLK